MQNVTHEPSALSLLLTMAVLIYGFAFLLKRDAGIRLVNKTIIRVIRTTVGNVLLWIGKMIRGH